MRTGVSGANTIVSEVGTCFLGVGERPLEGGSATSADLDREGGTELRGDSGLEAGGVDGFAGTLNGTVVSDS